MSEHRLGRFLGIDYGTKRIGLAISDEMGWTARPLETLDASSWKRVLARIRDVVASEAVEGVVLGSPASLKGHPGTLSGDVVRFKAHLEAEIPVPVVLWDERLSTHAAERILRDLGRKGEGMTDRAAAAWILQGYLDRTARDREQGDRT